MIGAPEEKELAVIVVGVDGSPAGLEATRWAAREAALRGVPLRIVHAMPQWACDTSAGGPYAEVARWMREAAESVLGEAVDQARLEERGVTVGAELLPGDPRQALIKAGQGAELLVTGNHGMGGFQGLLLGSVALGVAGHAECAVAVIRESPSTPRGEVVVGVDGSPRGASAIAFAFAEAALRGADLRAVHAWDSITPDVMTSREGLDAIPAYPRDAVDRRLLAEALAGWSERYPDVKLVEDVERGHPVDMLRRASAQADLLVVGSRGRGGISGLILGSVSHALLHHAACPTVIVP